MTREQMREYVRQNPIDWPPLTDAQRASLSSLLAPVASRTAVAPSGARRRRAA